MAANFKPWAYASANTVSVVDGPTSNPKKITGTRLGKILDLDSWGSPFQAWCEITRVAEPPFEGNKYTEAGNAIEPKLIEWCKSNVSPYVYTPEEFYGVVDAKQARRYDFFSHHPILGGMWDAVVLDGPLGKGKPVGYVEAKTSSRPQDWVAGPPDKYSLQGLLYSHLSGLPRTFIVVRFMQPTEYDNPHACECSEANTFCYDLKVADAVVGPDQLTIADAVDFALKWHETHVDNNVSPAFDPKKDAEYLKLMRSTEVTNDGLAALAMRAAVLEAKIEDIRTKNKLDELEKELKLIKDKQLKPQLIEQFKETDEVVVAYGWQVKKSQRTNIDKEALEQDGLLDKYSSTTDTYTMTKVKGQ